MTATWTSPNLAIRVEVGGDVVLLSADHGTSWNPMSAHAAREMARGLCNAADRAEEAQTENERSAA